MAKDKNPTDGGGGTHYKFGTVHAGPGAVFGNDMSKGKTIAGRDVLTSTTTTGESETASGMLGIGVGLLLLAVGIVLAVVVPGANLLVRFVFVFIVAMGAAMMANGLLGKMKYSKGPIKAYGPYAVFALVAAAGAVVIAVDRRSGAALPADKPPTSHQATP